jgi:hypothetical protein
MLLPFKRKDARDPIVVQKKERDKKRRTGHSISFLNRSRVMVFLLSF